MFGHHEHFFILVIHVLTAKVRIILMLSFFYHTIEPKV